MASVLTPVGFWSYARQDDRHSGGQLSELRAIVGSSLNMRWGEEVRLFQDSAAIPFGADWATTIESAIAQTTFFIPLVTPRFLKSENCRDEFVAFRKRMAALGRRNLIFPIHYVDIEQVIGPYTAFGDELAHLRTQQWIDFRALQFADPKSPQVRQWADSLARSIVGAMAQPVEVTVAPSAPPPAPVARAPPPPSAPKPRPYAAAMRRAAGRIVRRLALSAERDLGAATAKFLISVALFSALVLIVYKFDWEDIYNWALAFDSNRKALSLLAAIMVLSSFARFKTLVGGLTFLIVFWVVFRYAPLALGFTPWVYIFRDESWMVFFNETQCVEHFPQWYAEMARWDCFNAREFVYWFLGPVLAGRALFAFLQG